MGMFIISQKVCRIRLPAGSRASPESVSVCEPRSGTDAALLKPQPTTTRFDGCAPAKPQGCGALCALRTPRHAYGGPEPFGTGAGIVRWEREAGAMLLDHLRAEREKEWKRLRYKLVLDGPGPEDEQQLGPERTSAINRTRLQVRFKKFWDLMHERDRPWHFDVVVHLCTALSPYTCERYNSVTAGTMQGILAQRAKAERAVRDLREDCRTLRRRLTAMTLRMARSGRPVSEEQLSQMERLETQISAGSGIAMWQLRRLQAIARATYQDYDYEDYVRALLPLLQETKQLSQVSRRDMLPAARTLWDELAAFQEDLAERRLSRDQVLAFLERLRNRYLPAADDGAWPDLTADEEVGWRYPPLEYWRTDRRDSGAGRQDGGGDSGGGSPGATDGDDGGGGGGVADPDDLGRNIRRYAEGSVSD
ncbi:hypothetical protein Vretimale_3259 [Volvox reticuliferus]|uniref:Uncharacterized protein n=1 Tax=Volvox reticuliferus TaxID=1737510 RepID=A0A8J4FLF4_9CHLO|nr:hypothetical protein Vretifemale_6533 [Volvox reticuliferus]GIL97670.1 hypothetical protein Vretimale_3259 [Volvox reticuliferus]